VERFAQNLDSRIVLAIVRSGNVLTTTHYNQYRSLGNAMRHRRLQAAEAFPLIGTALLSQEKQYAHLRSAVDRKLPLTAAISKTLNVPQEVVRGLMGLDVACVGAIWTGRLGELAEYLLCVCPEHRPATPEDWTAFGDFTAAIKELETRSKGSQYLETVSAKTQLMHEIGKIGWHAARCRFVNMGAAISDIADISDLINEIVEVLAEHLGEGGVLSEVLIEDLVPPMKQLYFSMGITRQIQASRRWHQLMLEPVAPMEEHVDISSLPPRSWPAPFDGVLNIEGLSAICLTNTQQLKDEGMHMQHCVRNYTDHCLYYGSTIVSFRRNDGVRVSTAELNLVGDQSESLRFDIRQHRGLKNAEPPAEAGMALRNLMAMLNGAGASSRRQILHSALQKRKALRRDRPSQLTDPLRVEILKKALKLHVGYERFFEEALRVAGKQ
jgi:hypothetical protein